MKTQAGSYSRSDTVNYISICEDVFLRACSPHRPGPVVVCGLECPHRLAALIVVLEHELSHLMGKEEEGDCCLAQCADPNVFWLVYTNWYRCEEPHGNEFIAMSFGFFRHRRATHALPVLPVYTHELLRQRAAAGVSNVDYVSSTSVHSDSLDAGIPTGTPRSTFECFQHSFVHVSPADHGTPYANEEKELEDCWIWFVASRDNKRAASTATTTTTTGMPNTTTLCRNTLDAHLARLERSEFHCLDYENVQQCNCAEPTLQPCLGYGGLPHDIQQKKKVVLDSGLCICAYMRMRVRLCICAYVYAYVRICVCVCVCGIHSQKKASSRHKR